MWADHQGRRPVYLVALTGVHRSRVSGFYIAYSWFDLPLIPSLFVGGTVVATSIGITVRVLSDLKKQNTVISQIVLGARCSTTSSAS